MSILKKIKDKTGTIHDLGDSRVDAFETELSGAEHNVPYSPAVLAKTNAIEASVSAHIGNTANPHKVTKAQIGLANVENKSSTQIRSELTKENVTNALGYTPIDESRIGAANGVASLDASGRIPASQIPGGFDNIEEYDNLAAFPTTGEEGKIYVAKDTNLTYRWTGSQYVEISPSLALGETATTAYRGDRGKVAYDHSQVSGNSTIHHTHANKELLDSYTQTEADLANAVSKVHEHGNKSVLDGITSAKVNSWDGKASTSVATTGANGLMSKTDKAKLDGISSGANKADVSYASKKLTKTINGTTTDVVAASKIISDTNTFGNFAAVTDVNVDGTIYHTYWKIAPTSSNQVYGFAVHPNTGKLYRVYNNKGSYSVYSYDTDTNTTYSFDGTYNSSTNKAATVSSITSRIATAKTELTAAIDSEASARESADTTLQSNIDSVDAKGIVINKINGENVICFE